MVRRNCVKKFFPGKRAGTGSVTQGKNGDPTEKGASNKKGKKRVRLSKLSRDGASELGLFGGDGAYGYESGAYESGGESPTKRRKDEGDDLDDMHFKG